METTKLREIGRLRAIYPGSMVRVFEEDAKFLVEARKYWDAMVDEIERLREIERQLNMPVITIASH